MADQTKAEPTAACMVRIALVPDLGCEAVSAAARRQCSVEHSTLCRGCDDRVGVRIGVATK
jgi:hypothetical protein